MLNKMDEAKTPQKVVYISKRYKNKDGYQLNKKLKWNVKTLPDICNKCELN